jgi:hypothetical protein
MRGKPQQPDLGVLRSQRKGPLLVRRAPRGVMFSHVRQSLRDGRYPFPVRSAVLAPEADGPSEPHDADPSRLVAAGALVHFAACGQFRL